MDKVKNFLKDLTWEKINWSKSYKIVRQLQIKIYRAQKEGKKEKVYEWQKQLLYGVHSKLIAVAIASTLEPYKKKSLVSNSKSISNLERLKVAINLKISEKKVKYTGRKELKSLYQNSKQALWRLALDPQYENLFKKTCYGSRTTRTIWDAIDYLSSTLESSDYIHFADLKKSFKYINPKVFMEKLDLHSRLKKELNGFVNSGFFISEEMNFIKTEKSLLLPLFRDIIFQELNSCILEVMKSIHHLRPRPVIFLIHGYDYLIAGENEVTVTACSSEVNNFVNKLCSNSLKISLRTKSYSDGLEFLGFYLTKRKKTSEPIVTPKKKLQRKLIEQNRKIINLNKSLSSYKLINKLTPKIIDWLFYFKYYNCKHIFERLDNVIHSQLKTWVFRRTNTQSKIALKKKYFPEGKIYEFQGRRYKDNWVLTGFEYSQADLGKMNFLPKIRWVRNITNIKQFLYESLYETSYV